ncbi:MAG: hypothetical protein ABF289_01650 [Clostridiales bacterium]
MYKFRSLNCYYCKSLVLSLSEIEINKLNGFNFRCECCGHQNKLSEFKFYKGTNKNHHNNTYSIENLPIL